MPKRSLPGFLRSVETDKDKRFATYFSRSDQVLKDAYYTLSEYLDAIHSDAYILEPYLSGQEKAIDQLVNVALLEMGFTDENVAPADLVADVRDNVQNQILTHNLESQKLSVIVSNSQPFPEYDDHGNLQPNRQQDCIDTATKLKNYFKQQMVLKLAGERAKERETARQGIPIAPPDWNLIDDSVKKVAIMPLSNDVIEDKLKTESNPLIRDILLERQKLLANPNEEAKQLEEEVLEGDYPQALKLAYFSANAYAALATAANNQRKIKDNLGDPDTANIFAGMYISYCSEAGRQMEILQKIHKGPKLKQIEKTASRESYLLGRAINRLSEWGSSCKSFFKNAFKSSTLEQKDVKRDNKKSKR